MMKGISKAQNKDAGSEKPIRQECFDDKNISEKDKDKCEYMSDDEEYWEEMFFLSLGPRKWNIGCGCG